MEAPMPNGPSQLDSRPRRVATILFAFAFSLPLALPSLPVAVTRAQGNEATRAAVDSAIAFRESFGLRAGREFVEDSLTRGGYSRVPYGIPLSDDELADMRHRLDIQMSLGPATVYASDQPGYAGVYLDQDRGGRPVFLFTRDDSDRDATIGRRLGDDIAYDVRLVEYSLDRLRDVKYEVMDDVARAWDAGVFVVSIGPDIERNRVAVGVEGLDQGDREYLERYGPEVVPEAAVTAQSDACTVTDCLSAKAGLKIVAPNNGHCTEGPYVRRGSANRLITAGHCFGLNGGSGETWEHHNEAVAESSGNTWSQVASSPGDPNDRVDTDAGIFLATAGGYEPNEYNKAVFYDADADVLRQGHFISWSYNVAQPVNGQVCRTGWKSFGNPAFPPCGKIVQADHWQWSCEGPGTDPPCAAIDHEWKVNFDTTGGDSGGPYYSPPNSSWNASLYGIATHSVPDGRCTDNDPDTLCRAWYTPATWIDSGFSAIGVTVSRFCVDADCGPVMCFTWGCAP
jgi:hypothetical protein